MIISILDGLLSGEVQQTKEAESLRRKIQETYTKHVRPDLSEWHKRLVESHLYSLNLKMHESHILPQDQLWRLVEEHDHSVFAGSEWSGVRYQRQQLEYASAFFGDQPVEPTEQFQNEGSHKRQAPDSNPGPKRQRTEE